MPKIIVNVEELIEFIERCTNDDGVQGYKACKICPVRKECNYYYTRKGESGALTRVNLDR